MNTSTRFSLLTLILSLVTVLLLVLAIQLLTTGALSFNGQSLASYGIAAVIGLILWGGIQAIGRSAIQQAAQEQIASQASQAPVSRPSVGESPVSPIPKPIASAVKKEEPVDKTALAHAGALQILSIFQRKGRLIDFLQEDLSAYDDAQVGAAVRSIHNGCRDALAETLTLEPVIDDSEGNRVTVEPGFDAHAIRLSGNVSGNPPFLARFTTAAGV